MKTLRVLCVCLGFLLSSALLSAQDLSKYRGLSLGMDLAQLSKHVGMSPEEASVIIKRPSLIQELTWRPPQPLMAEPQNEPVQQVIFSFLNRQLYRITVLYDRDRTEGITLADMRQILSVQYGPEAAMGVRNPAAGARDDEGNSPVARWEDAQFRVELFQTSWKEYRLLITSQTLEVQASVASAFALSMDAAEAPAKEALRQKKEAADLASARQANKKLFRP
jgi:hypothetical protein